MRGIHSERLEEQGKRGAEYYGEEYYGEEAEGYGESFGEGDFEEHGAGETGG